MTTDERISQDLAVVGRVSRERPIAVEATLRMVGAQPAPRAQRSAAPSSTNALALLRLSSIYALRAARTSAGVAAVVCTLGLLLYTTLVGRGDWWQEYDTVLLEPIWVSKFWVASGVALVVCSVYLVGLRVGLHRFQTLVAPAELVTALGLVRRASRWSALASIAGAMTSVLFFGMMQVTIGGYGLANLFSPGPIEPSLQPIVGFWTVTFLVAAIVGSLIGTVLDVRRARAPSKLRALMGLGLVVATIVVGLRYDTGSFHVDFPEGMPSLSFRGCLTVTGTLGLFLLVSTIALRIRAREDQEIEALTSAGG